MYHNGHIVDPKHAHVQVYFQTLKIYILTGNAWTFNFFIHNNRDMTFQVDTVPYEGSNRTVDKNFSFCYFRLFRVPRTWTGRIQMKSSMSFMRRNRCIGEKNNF